jgi:hypothetical protein
MKRAIGLSMLLLAACGGSSNNSNTGFDAKCQPATGNKLNATCDPGFTSTAPNAPQSVQVTFSGETLAVNGLPFQPVNAGDPSFVDGWDMHFDEVLVVLGNFRLSPGATQFGGTSLSAQVNPSVATKKGPYVVDMHKPVGFVGKDGVEPAQAIFKWDAQDNGQKLDTGTLYAFSYDTLKATYPVANVNLTPDQQADYDLMVANGWSKLYRGTATYVGTGKHPDTTIQAKFDALPKTVKFFFGWNDGTSYINCANPDNGGSSGGDPSTRGIKPSPSGAAIAQITLHVDHVFWDEVLIEGTPLRFDHIAAWAGAGAASTPVDLTKILHRPLALTFSDGTPIPDRAIYQNVPGGYTTDQSNPSQVTLNLNGLPSGDAPDIINFMAFSAQSQMHLNANGICYVAGQHSADPFYSPGIK